jgi:hypothetical protein
MSELDCCFTSSLYHSYVIGSSPVARQLSVAFRPVWTEVSFGETEILAGSEGEKIEENYDWEYSHISYNTQHEISQHF